jgi:hypothetical protein
MNKLTLAFLLFTTPASGESTEFNTRHTCDAAHKILNFTVSEFNEAPLFKGIGFPVYYDAAGVKSETEAYAVLFVNQDTGTWSLIYAFGDDTACIIADGAAFEPYSE